jgi:hypothetical protein
MLAPEPIATKIIGVVLIGIGVVALVGATLVEPGTYRPDRELPHRDNGKPVRDRYPDKPEVREEDRGQTIRNPHTQIGTRGTDHPYTVGRTWGDKVDNVPDWPETDYDFDDHGRPNEHPNPHKHPRNPRTGERGDPEPL